MVLFKSVDSIVRKFNAMVDDLNDLAEDKEVQVKIRNQSIEQLELGNKEDEKEIKRARTIAANIEKLVSGV